MFRKHKTSTKKKEKRLAKKKSPEHDKIVKEIDTLCQSLNISDSGEEENKRGDMATANHRRKRNLWSQQVLILTQNLNYVVTI